MSYTFLVKKNNSKSTLNGAIGVLSGSVYVLSAALFPTAASFLCTIWDKITYADPTDDAAMEIVKITALSGTAFTISRAQEGTVAASHADGNAIELLITKGNLDEYENQINGVLNGTFTYGPDATEGSWRSVLVGSNLSFQRYESGIWNEKMAVTP